MKLSRIEDLFELSLKDMFSAENQLLKALPLMAKTANTPSLKEAFEMHLKETEKQIDRLEKIGKEFDLSLGGHTCKAMKGLIEEGSEIIKTEGEEVIIDSALIGAAQKVEHYEISAYASLLSLAESLGYSEAVKLLEESLNEENETVSKLEEILIEEILNTIE